MDPAAVSFLITTTTHFCVETEIVRKHPDRFILRMN
jgi:hypothetical protein